MDLTEKLAWLGMVIFINIMLYSLNNRVKELESTCHISVETILKQLSKEDK